jgi:uncharacterized protein YbjT (DUF2867 family)
MSAMKTLLILGGSGLVGTQIVELALENPNVQSVVAPTRRPLAPRPKLHNPIVDYAQLPGNASWWVADTALCALGTTLRQAGSAAAFRRVDHDYVLAAAQLTHNAGTPAFVYSSSIRANATARSLYLRVKGETEQDLAAVGFESLCHVRPSLLDGGPRPDFRPAETAILWLARRLAPIIPRQYRAVSTHAVAATMLLVALDPQPGVRVIESAQIHD